MASPPFITTLNCRHNVLYSPPPVVKDVVWCQHCTDYRVCVRVVKAWRMECAGCHSRHQYGVDESRIRRQAMRHLRLNPDHTVYVINGDTWEKIVSLQESLPFVT